MKKCFVMMPFKGTINTYYKDIFKPVIESEGLIGIRSDEHFGARPIISDIINSINESDIILADLTNKNPNVNYELGMAHALGKPTILIAQNKKDLPFDYQHIRVYFYDTSSTNWQKDLSTYIAKSIRSIITSPDKYSLFHNEINQVKKIALTKFLETHNLQVGKIDREYEFYIDEKGNCTATILWYVEASSNINILRHKFFVTDPGEIKILELFDYYTGKKLEYIVETSDAISMSFFILLDNKPPNTKFKVKEVLFAENYISDLIGIGTTICHHFNIYETKLMRNDRSVKYFFPKTKQFENLTAIMNVKYSTDELTQVELIKSIHGGDKYLFSYENKSDKTILEFNINFVLQK